MDIAINFTKYLRKYTLAYTRIQKWEDNESSNLATSKDAPYLKYGGREMNAPYFFVWPKWLMDFLLLCATVLLKVK